MTKKISVYELFYGIFRIELANDRSETFIRAIENNTNPQMDSVCCILTNNRKDRYDAIKKVLCRLSNFISSAILSI
jgi:hypothetical protein